MEVKRDKAVTVPDKAKLPEGMIRPREYAKSSCNKCYGKGIVGVNTLTDSYVICKCVQKELARRKNHGTQ